jgi:hypothetical protein
MPVLSLRAFVACKKGETYLPSKKLFLTKDLKLKFDRMPQVEDKGVRF